MVDVVSFLVMAGIDDKGDGFGDVVVDEVSDVFDIDVDIDVDVVVVLLVLSSIFVDVVVDVDIDVVVLDVVVVVLVVYVVYALGALEVVVLEVDLKGEGILA